MRRFALSFPSQKENQVSISRPAETQPQLRVSYLQHDAVFDASFCTSGLVGSLFGELLGGSLAEDTVALESGPGDLGVAIAVRDVHNHAVLGGVKLVASLGNQRLKISYIFLLCNQSTVTPSWDGKCR